VLQATSIANPHHEGMPMPPSPTKPPPLPTPWNVFNLVASPFFQQPLEFGEYTPRPLTLFVGRTKELAKFEGTIHGADQNGTVQALAGAPGIGKTTLIKELKAKLASDDYFTIDAVVPILPNDTPESLFGRTLGSLYDTILANRPMTSGHAAMMDAQLVVRATRIPTGGLNLTVPGLGGIGATRGTAVSTPKDLMIDGPRIMRDLVQLVLGSGARGVLLHLNNLENLSERDATTAAELLRALRDVMLLHSGLHYVIVGTADAVNAAINRHAQVRSVVSTLVLEPLPIGDVHALLKARYQHLRVSSKKPVIEPIDAAAVAGLYEFFRGDLRGLLKALEDGVSPLIGLAGASVTPLSLASVRPVLKQRYRTELGARADQHRAKQLTVWGKTPTAVHTQKSLAQLWKISQGQVSKALASLLSQGYVVQRPRVGKNAAEYALSGVSRLIFE
jgi:hypothetical protein